MAERQIDFHDPGLTAAAVRAALALAPHPEGGWFRESWRDVPAEPGKRGAATVIYFLLAAGEESVWHRVDATELWLFHAGAPLELRILEGKDAHFTTRFHIAGAFSGRGAGKCLAGGTLNWRLEPGFLRRGAGF